MEKSKNTITRLQFQRTSQRVNVFLNGRFAFGLRTDVALEAHLSINQEITETKIKELLGRSVILDLYDSTLRFLSIRPRSVFEMKQYLVKRIKVFKDKTFKGSTALQYTDVLPEPETLINQTIQKLSKQNYVNDADFARWWVEQRLLSKPRGKYALAAELAVKGVDKEIIQEVLSQTPELSKERVPDMIENLMNKAWRSIQHRHYDRQKAKEVLARRLLAKGFAWDEIALQIDEFLTKQYN